MKKLGKALVCAVVIALTAIALTACAGKPSGKFVFSEFTMTNASGASFTAKKGDDFTAALEKSSLTDTEKLGAAIVVGLFSAVTMEFSGNNLTMKFDSLLGESKPEDKTIEFKMDGNKIIGLAKDGEEDDIEIGGSDGEFVFKGGKIIMSSEKDGVSVKVVFVKGK